MKIRLRDRTGTRDYKFLIEDVDRHGNVRLYFRRRPEPKVRLLQRPGTAAFEAEYLKAYRGEVVLPAAGDSVPRVRGAAATGTMRWLVEQYYASAAFCRLDGDTRRVRRRILDAICERAGPLAFAAMEPKHVAKLRDEKAETPDAANSYVKALRAVFKWACSPEYGHATRNPAKDVGYLKPNNPDGYRTWTEAEVAQFEARHPIGTKARLALDLFLYTGVRISDVVRLGPQMERFDGAGGKLVFSEQKGRGAKIKTHELPILPPLRASIEAYRAQQGAKQHLVYLVTAFGQPHTVKGFGNWFVRQCRIAGLAKGLSAHGIRKCGAVRCVNAGATEHQLMALFGWETSKQAALYTRRANRRQLEAGAAPLLQRMEPEGAQSENKKAAISGKKVPLFPVVPPSGTIRAKKS
jgi:integrase